jgi:organic radical activating enzyme
MKIDHLAIEITRKCNIQCEHCIRGYAQNRNVPLRYIDILLDRVEYIGHFCPTGGEPSLNIPAIQYFIDGCIDRQIRIGRFYISTNGINIKQDFIDICLDLYNLCDDKQHCSVQISNDKYHLERRKYDDILLSCLPFYSKRYTEGSDMKGVVVYEGLAAKNDLKIAKHYFRSAKGKLYLNAEGDFIDGDCWSYENQKHHKLCNIYDLIKFKDFLNQQKMHDNKFVEEDFERIPLLDKLYLQEKEREIWEEYQQWIEDQERLPAIIEVIIPEKLNHEYSGGNRKIKATNKEL